MAMTIDALASAALAADSPPLPGSTNVHSLAGGFEAWRNAVFPTTSE